MAKISVPETAKGRAALREEITRTILREAVERFNNELLDDEERQMLLDRIRRLRQRLSS